MNIPNVGYPYAEFDDVAALPGKFSTGDHLGGFDQNLHNVYLARLNHYASLHDRQYQILTEQIFPAELTRRYPCLDIRFDLGIFEKYSQWNKFELYTTHPEQTFQNFLCSFNGGPHVSRKLLVSVLHRMGWFCPDTCSKNFVFSADVLDGHISDLCLQRSRFYRRFFIGEKSEDFFQTRYSFGHLHCEHDRNIHNLDSKITRSFLHVVSESMSTSYHPFVTEKFLYSVVTRGLFVAYAQPGWHDYLERCYGFKKYNNIFDYDFDSIVNPLDRLLALMSMISKFSVLSTDDWRDLYEMESETIEHNYDWYFTKQYIRHIEQFVT